MFGICKKGSIVFSLELFLTYEQAELFTAHIKKKKKIAQVHFLGRETDLKFRNVSFYLIL